LRGLGVTKGDTFASDPPSLRRITTVVAADETIAMHANDETGSPVRWGRHVTDDG
jgi:hypothetical protein